MLEFEFPDTGEGVTEGQFLEWQVEEGDQIEEDQVVAEVETDKAVVDIPAPTSGVVKELKASPGDKIKVGDVIMIIDDSGSGDVQESSSEETDNVDDSSSDDQSAEPGEKSGGGEESEEPEEVEVEQTSDKGSGEPETSSSGDVLALPKVRKLAEEKGVDLASIKTGERITEEEVLEAAGDESYAKNKTEDQETVEETGEPEQESRETVSTSGANASPSVRRLARENSVDLSGINGSGRGGTVTRNDVLEAAGTGEHETKHAVSSGEKEERVELSGVRKNIADKMAKSRFTAPHVTHVDKADVTELVEIRNQKKDRVDVHLTYLPFIVKAVMLAMKNYPELNAELDEDNDEIVLKKHYDFNIAVDTDRGLMVPLIEEVDEKNIVELAAEIGDKAGAAKHGELGAEDMRNGTFSITNLGVIGGEEFTPIINYPQTSILGVGKIQETAEVVDGEVVPRHTVKLSLSYDHRVIDGATAARFMNEVIENLEDPDQMLLEL